MTPALREMLTDTVLVAPPGDVDAYGVPSYGAFVARPARIQRRMTSLFTPQGPQLVPETKVFLDATDGPMTEDMRVQFPDGTQPPIRGLDTLPDEHGKLDHYVCYF